MNATELVRRLESAHGDLLIALEIASLAQHESYEEIHEAIENIEAALEWLRRTDGK